MIVLSHRGLWEDRAERNTIGAFQRSFDAGLGTETDVRDSQGRLVISHDMALGGEQPFDDFLAQAAPYRLPLAINVKADGLSEPLVAAMRAHASGDWFVFDMSVPETRAYLRAGAPVFTRMSEYERHPAFLDRATGIWLDAFESDWYGDDELTALLARTRVCVVSPELHGRDPHELWARLKALPDTSRLMLCTDLAPRAKECFGSLVEVPA